MPDLAPALLLDLDDTILCFSSGAEPAWREVCERHEAGRAAALFAAIRSEADVFWSDAERARQGRLDLPSARRRIVARALRSLGLDDDAVRVARIAEDYGAIRDAKLVPFPGAIEAVREFRARGSRLALLTNGAAEGQRAKVTRFGLDRLFDAVLIEGELGVGKPERRVFELALEQLGAAPGEAWMVGDNLEADVGGAQSVGIHGIWHDFDRSGLPAGARVVPDRIVHALEELL